MNAVFDDWTSRDFDLPLFVLLPISARFQPLRSCHLVVKTSSTTHLFGGGGMGMVPKVLPAEGPSLSRYLDTADLTVPSVSNGRCHWHKGIQEGGSFLR